MITFFVSFGLTKVAFYEERPVMRPKFAQITDRIISLFIGSRGEPVQLGLDPTPPPGI